MIESQNTYKPPIASNLLQHHRPAEYIQLRPALYFIPLHLQACHAKYIQCEVVTISMLVGCWAMYSPSTLHWQGRHKMKRRRMQRQDRMGRPPFGGHCGPTGISIAGSSNQLVELGARSVTDNGSCRTKLNTVEDEVKLVVWQVCILTRTMTKLSLSSFYKIFSRVVR